MELSRPRMKRLPVVLLSSAIIVSLLACSIPGCNPSSAQASVTVCAIDPIQSVCTTGDIQALHRTQRLRLTALDGGGKALPDTTVTITVSGANPKTDTLTTHSDGTAEYTYQGSSDGTDTIKASVTVGSKTFTSNTAVVHWLPQRSVIHPIVFLHGVNENASVLVRHAEWTSLFEAIGATYDPKYVEMFCYADDREYTDATPACPQPEQQDCVTASHPTGDYPECVSQSRVSKNGIELAKVVIDLAQRATLAAGKPEKVTLMGYSMGSAIMRTMLAGCPDAADAGGNPADNDPTFCQTADALVDNAFFLNGVQQGSWLMKAKSGWDAASLYGQEIPSGSSSPFLAVLPMLEQATLSALQDKLGGLSANSFAAQDLTPQSRNIVAHNSVPTPLPPTVASYDFYGDDQLGLGTSMMGYKLPPTQVLPLGDLVLLAQDDGPTAVPPWGGAALCGGCGSPISGYREGGTLANGQPQYHAWALIDRHDMYMDSLVPILTVPSAKSGFDALLASPVTHLNISQPIAQAPGSSLTVKDITGRVGSGTTDMASEIIAIMMQNDGIV